MAQDTTVYDLGEVDRELEIPPEPVAHTMPKRPSRPAAPRLSHAGRAQAIRGEDLSGSLSLLVPGTGQMIRGELTTGLFFLSTMSFLVALAWALLNTLDRITETLVLLGQSGAIAVWVLISLYGLAAILHVSSVLSAVWGEWPSPRMHPVLAGIASGVLPGWGQVLNRNPVRAGLFLAGLWIIGAAWILDSAAAGRLLDSYGLHLPMWLEVVTSPAVLWVVPPVIWTLAVYDAATTAANQR